VRQAPPIKEGCFRSLLSPFTLSDEEIGMNQIVLQQLGKLSVENKKKVIQYANDLLQASS